MRWYYRKPAPLLELLRYGPGTVMCITLVLQLALPWYCPPSRRYCDPVVATGWHMVLGGLPLLGLALAQEGPEIGPALAQLTGAPGRAPVCARVHILRPAFPRVM